jgi:hypothetical protein
MLSLRMEDANFIQEALVLAQSGPLPSLVMAQPFHVGNRAILPRRLVTGLRTPGLIHVSQLLVLLCVPCVEVASFIRAYLLVMISISSDVLGSFMASL